MEVSNGLGWGLGGTAWTAVSGFKTSLPIAVPSLAAEKGGGALAPRVELAAALS